MSRLEMFAGPLFLIAAVLCTTLLCVATASGQDAQGLVGRWMVAEVTAYCPCSDCCGTHDKATANNTNTDLVPYAFASDRSLPFGARIFVPAGLGVLDRVRAGNRWFTVDDRGGALDTEARKYGVLRLDLRVKDHSWAVRFGRKSIPVFVFLGNSGHVNMPEHAPRL